MKKIIVLVVAVVIATVTISSCTSCTSFNDHTYTVSVTDKERINTESGGKYLIYGFDGDDSMVLQNTDSLFRGKFNSSNVYAEIEIGKTYDFTVVGCRIPLLSMYENIIDYQVVE